MKKSCTEVQHRSDRVILALKIARPVTFLCEREGHGGKISRRTLRQPHDKKADRRGRMETVPRRKKRSQPRDQIQQTLPDRNEQRGRAHHARPRGIPPRTTTQNTRAKPRSETLAAAQQAVANTAHGGPGRRLARRIKMEQEEDPTMWVISWCDHEGTWHKEAWRYGEQSTAMAYAEGIMQQKTTQAVIVEQVSTEHSCGPIPTRDWPNNRYGTIGGLWCLREDPWNWKKEDWQRGVRVRERARKKHRQE